MTSSHALNNATLALGLQLADQGLDALRKNKHLRNGLNVHRGAVTHKAAAEALNLPFKDPLEALG